MDFRFSPKPNKAALIEWRPWTAETFAEAEATDKPVLLSIAAIWCHWCHVMDETTFSNEEVIEGLNRDFIPVRVDNDRRPDINARYNMGGWPSLAFLTPDGEVMMGATYVPPKRFREMMDAVHKLWEQKSGDIREEVSAARGRAERLAAETRPAGEIDESLVTRAFAPLFAVYDREYGGFGDGAKFPRVDILEALLSRLETEAAGPQDVGAPSRGGAVAGMLAKTLEAMLADDLWDPVEYGFFRYTTRRDWTVPHFEKMLEDNAGLIRILARASLMLGRPDFLEAARKAQDYLDRVLYHPEERGYGGSQDADEEYYAATAHEERAKLRPPYADPIVYSDWNAQEIRALCALHDVARREAAQATGAPGGPPKSGALDRAVSVAEMLLARRSGRGLLPHDPAQDAPDSFVEDQVDFFAALLDLYEASSERRWREAARALWEAIDRHFTGREAPLVADLAREPSPLRPAAEAEARVGRLGRPDARPQENARLAAALNRLAHIERDRDLHERAAAMLSALTTQVDGLRDLGAEIGRAALLALRGPLHVTIVGDERAPDTRALLAAAHSLPFMNRLVDLLDPEHDGELLARAGFEGSTRPAAYVCRGNSCSAPITEPAALWQVRPCSR